MWMYFHPCSFRKDVRQAVRATAELQASEPMVPSNGVTSSFPVDPFGTKETFQLGSSRNL